MAKVVCRRRADGGTSYRVTWVLGGGRAITGATAGEPGSQASETFTDHKLMLVLKAAVETQGHRWPLGWVKGRGWIAREEPRTHAEPEPAAASVDDVYAGWLRAEHTKIAFNRKKPKSVGGDARIYERLIRPAFGTRPFSSIQRAEIADWVEQMTLGGAAAKTVRNRHAVLHAGRMVLCRTTRRDTPLRGRPRRPRKGVTSGAVSLRADGFPI